MEKESSRPPMGRPGPGGRPQGAPRPYGPPGQKGRRPPLRRRLCRICKEKGGIIDWKAVNYLRYYVTEQGKMIGARSKGTCSRCQRALTRAIKRARNMALLPTASS